MNDINNINIKEQYICDLSQFCFEIINKCKSNIKLSKTQGPDDLSAEHLVHAYPLIFLHLCNLFKAIALNGFVPDDFGL